MHDCVHFSISNTVQNLAQLSNRIKLIINVLHPWAVPHLRLAEESLELKLTGGSIDASLLIDTQLDSGAGDMDLMFEIFLQEKPWGEIGRYNLSKCHEMNDSAVVCCKAAINKTNESCCISFEVFMPLLYHDVLLDLLMLNCMGSSHL